jgi:hypothetical protein
MEHDFGVQSLLVESIMHFLTGVNIVESLMRPPPPMLAGRQMPCRGTASLSDASRITRKGCCWLQLFNL